MEVSVQVEYASLNFAAARSFVSNARGEFSQGNTKSAEKGCIEALIQCPNYFPAFQLLGECLDSAGQHECAAAAYLGNISNTLGQKYCLTESGSTPRGSISGRQHVHQREEISLPQPNTLDNVPLWKFRNKKIVSNETWVDTIELGSIWHDGHNNASFDSDDHLIEDHLTGCVSIVEDLRKRCSPLFAGPRVFVLGARGGGNYYHWMTDILPKLEILRQAGYVFNNTDRFLVSSCDKSFQKETLIAFGVKIDQVIETNTVSPYLSSDLLVIPRLKNVMGLHMGSWLPAFLEDLLLNRPGIVKSSSVASSQSRIFISRDPASSNGRSIGNIEAVNGLFQSYGFEIVYPERLSLVEQARCFNSADVIVAAHGAGLANIVFCQPGTTVIEFYGAHIAPCYWAISAIKNLQYFNECCLDKTRASPEDASTLSERRSAGFSVDTDRLRSLLEMAGIGS